MSLDYCVTYVPGLYQHALQLTKELLIVRAPRALLWNPLQLNSGVDMTGLLSRENWNGMDLR